MVFEDRQSPAAPALVAGQGDGGGQPPKGAAEPGRAPGKPKKGKGGSKAKVKRGELGRQVAGELHKLRPQLKEITSGLFDRLDGQLAGLALFLEGEAMPEEVAVLPSTRLMAAMLAQIRALKVKPHKGRVKDLARIEALLEALSAKTPPGS